MHITRRLVCTGWWGTWEEQAGQKKKDDESKEEKVEETLHNICSCPSLYSSEKHWIGRYFIKTWPIAPYMHFSPYTVLTKSMATSSLEPQVSLGSRLGYSMTLENLVTETWDIYRDIRTCRSISAVFLSSCSSVLLTRYMLGICTWQVWISIILRPQGEQFSHCILIWSQYLPFK